MTRAVTSPELAKLRSDGQYSKLYLAIIKPDVVMTAQVDGTPASNDEVASLPYFGLSYGAPTAVEYGQTIFIGSTAGGYEYGMVRAVSAVSSGSTTGIITIGITSEINWTDGAYITVLREYGFWPKTAKMSGISMLCDDDKEYTDQHSNCAPVPVMGPDNVIKLSGSAVTVPLSAGSSWIPYGSSGSVVASTIWTCASASGSYAIDDTMTAVTFYTPATYTMACTVANSEGATTTGHRTYYVWSEAAPPATQFTLESLQGDWRTGGWGFELTMYAEVDRATVYDRAKVMLFAESYYGGSPVNMGPLAGYESLIAVGWVDGQSMTINPELNTIRFSAHGPQWWLNKIASWPAGIRGHLNVPPTNWNEYEFLTYDAFMWHILRWRCTASEIIDIFPSNVLTRMVGADAPWGTIWGQFTQVADAKHLIHPCCNRYGQLYNQRNVNTSIYADRVAVPVVMPLTKQDWGDTLEIERRIVPEVGFMDTTGMFWNGTSAGGYRAGSWGTAVGRFGRMERRTELYIDETDGQTTLNTWAGILLGNANIVYPRISAQLAQFNTFFDIAPNQYGQFSIAAADTPLNMTVVNEKFTPRTVSYTWDSATGAMITNIMGEGGALIEHGFYLPFYYGPGYQQPPATPWNPWTPGSRRVRPPARPLCTALNAPGNGPFMLPVSAQVYSGSPAQSWLQPYHCKFRDKDAAYPTVLSVDCTTYVQDSVSGSGWELASGSAPILAVTAFDGSGSTILTGVQRAYTGGATGTRYFDFSPNDPMEVWGLMFSGSTVPVSGSALTPVGTLAFDSYVGTYDPRDQFGNCTYTPVPTTGGSYIPNGILYVLAQSSCPYDVNNIHDNFYFQIELPASPGTGRIVFDAEIDYPNNSNRDSNYTGILLAPAQLSGSAIYTFSGTPLYGSNSMRVDTTPVGPGVLTSATPRAMIDRDLNWSPTGDMTRWFGITLLSNYRVSPITITIYGVYWRTDSGDTAIWNLGNATRNGRAVINAARISNVCRYFDP